MGLVRWDEGWRVPDELWAKMDPLLPPRPEHPLGCHNPRTPDRRAMDAILLPPVASAGTPTRASPPVPPRSHLARATLPPGSHETPPGPLWECQAVVSIIAAATQQQGETEQGPVHGNLFFTG